MTLGGTQPHSYEPLAGLISPCPVNILNTGSTEDFGTMTVKSEEMVVNLCEN